MRPDEICLCDGHGGVVSEFSIVECRGEAD